MVDERGSAFSFSLLDSRGLLETGVGSSSIEVEGEVVLVVSALEMTGVTEVAGTPKEPLPVTRTVYHRGSHMEGTVALKHGLVARGILEHATIRSPLLPLEPGADVEIANALRSAGLVGQPSARSRDAA